MTAHAGLRELLQRRAGSHRSSVAPRAQSVAAVAAAARPVMPAPVTAPRAVGQRRELGRPSEPRPWPSHSL